MALVDGLPSVILENVAKLIEQKVPADQAPLVKQFSEILYSNMSAIDLSNRNDSDMYGATLSLWNSLNSHKDKSPVIRVFNPEVSKHGWKSSHTVIEVVVNDMPFLVDSMRIALNRKGLSPHLMINRPINVIRGKEGQVNKLSSTALKSASSESVFFIEIDRQTDAKELDGLREALLSVVSGCILDCK